MFKGCDVGFATLRAVPQLFAVKLGGCLDDPREARLQGLLREKACPNCVSGYGLDALFGCDESSQVSKSSDVRALLNPLPDWPALRVACAVLSSVRPGESRSRDRCPISS